MFSSYILVGSRGCNILFGPLPNLNILVSLQILCHVCPPFETHVATHACEAMQMRKKQRQMSGELAFFEKCAGIGRLGPRNVLHAEEQR